jgi:phage shock protein A
MPIYASCRPSCTPTPYVRTVFLTLNVKSFLTSCICVLSQNDLVKVRQSYAEALASQRRIQRQLDEFDRVANEWYNRAQLALRQQQKQSGPDSFNMKNERLAREALLRRETELERKSMIQKQLDTQTMATDQLYNAIVTLEQQIREVMSKQQQLVARARTAEATKQIQSMILGQFDSTTALSNSMNAFTRMEQKVEAMEAAVEASIELNQMQWSTSSLTAVPDVDISSKNTKRSLEDDFRYLEQSSKIEEELEYLKNKLNFAGSNGNSSPPSVGPVSTSSNIDTISFLPTDEQQRKRTVSIPISRRKESLSIL